MSESTTMAMAPDRSASATGPAVRRCRRCGAAVSQPPDATTPHACAACGVARPLPESEADIEPFDASTQLAPLVAATATIERQTVRCAACGAELSAAHDTHPDACPYCGTAPMTPGGTVRMVRPAERLPFAVDREQAAERVCAWLGRFWFTPGELCGRGGVRARLAALYTPAWLFDFGTVSFFRGERGVDYTITDAYVEVVGGRKVLRKHRHRETRWAATTGVVCHEVRDLFVPAGTALERAVAETLAPRDPAALVPYRDAELGEAPVEPGGVDLAAGFEAAREQAGRTVERAIRRQISGDHQRVFAVHTQYSNLRVRSILLPVWVSSHRYRGRTYRFVVNGHTGDVYGERPLSWAKVAAVLGVGLGLGVLLVAGLIVAF